MHSFGAGYGLLDDVTGERRYAWALRSLLLGRCHYLQVV